MIGGRLLLCHVTYGLLYLQVVRCWRVPGRPEAEQNVDSSENIFSATNIQNRAAGSFIWSRPPLMTSNNEELSSDPVRVTDSDRRPTPIRQCTQLVERPGLYKIRGFLSSASSPSSSLCYVMIKAPALQRIRVTLHRVDVDCQRSGLRLFDGWQLIDRKGPSILDTIPSADGDVDGRKLHLCSENAAAYRTLETSQNIGQIMYILRGGDEVLVHLDFIPDEQACNTYIGRDDEPITLNLRTDRAQDCRIYISGSARLRLSSVNLANADGDATACGSPSTNYVSVQANSTTWDPNSVPRRIYNCDTDLSDFNTPCRYNVIELHTVSRAIQTVTLSIDPLADEQREPWSYYCY